MRINRKWFPSRPRFPIITDLFGGAPRGRVASPYRNDESVRVNIRLRSYCKISWSLEPTRLGVKMFTWASRFDRHIQIPSLSNGWLASQKRVKNYEFWHILLSSYCGLSVRVIILSDGRVEYVIVNHNSTLLVLSLISDINPYRSVN